jgi:hypothetical protein
MFRQPGSIGPECSDRPVLHLRVHGRPKTTEREPGELGAAYRQIEGGVGRLVEWLEPITILVEFGILAAARVAVVLVHCRHEGTRGEPESRLHLRDGVEAIDQRLLEELVWRVSESLRVEDQVADPVRLLDEKSGGPPVIGILRPAAPCALTNIPLACQPDGEVRNARPTTASPPPRRKQVPDPSSLLVPCFIRSRGIGRAPSNIGRS